MRGGSLFDLLGEYSEAGQRVKIETVCQETLRGFEPVRKLLFRGEFFAVRHQGLIHRECRATLPS